VRERVGLIDMTKFLVPKNIKFPAMKQKNF
jgi:hypothetical protein